MTQTTEALRRLDAVLTDLPSMLVAFSGGVDSALLAFVGKEVLGDSCVAVTADSPSLPRQELAAARDFCRAHHIRHVEISTHELDLGAYVANGPDRCFHCKSALFDALEPLRQLLGAPVALGTNIDDLGDHRPGQNAALQRGAITPLVEAGFTKELVRAAAHHLGLEVADKPAAACLSSRVAYDDLVTADLLARIETAEVALKDLGFDVCRVRSHAGGVLARVEVPATQIEAAARLAGAIDSAIKRAGFLFCSLDLAGFASGSMNVLISPESLIGRLSTHE